MRLGKPNVPDPTKTGRTVEIQSLLKHCYFTCSTFCSTEIVLDFKFDPSLILKAAGNHRNFKIS